MKLQLKLAVETCSEILPFSQMIAKSQSYELWKWMQNWFLCHNAAYSLKFCYPSKKLTSNAIKGLNSTETLVMPMPINNSSGSRSSIIFKKSLT